MNPRAGRTRLISSVVGLLLACGVLAAPAPGGVLAVPAPEAVEPAGENALTLIRDHVYSRAKDLGVAPDVLAPALARISEQAAAGQVDMASINDVTATISDYDVAMKVEGFLLGYAETAALGVVIDGALPEDGPVEAKALAKEAVLGRIEGMRRIDSPPGGLAPLNGGICATCPSFDFAPPNPTTTWQTHTESTDSSVDCNTYQFNVVTGFTYEFSLCPADGGSAAWDTELDLLNTGSCVVLANGDDECGQQSKITWLSNVTGTVNLRVRGFSISNNPPWAFGSYTLAYRQTPCTTCAAPNPTTLLPDLSCQIASGNVSSVCPTLFWLVDLTAGNTYEFSTCPLNCAGSSCTTIPDTFLELYAPGSAACTSAPGDRVAVNDDASAPACMGSTFRSRITYLAAVSGLHKVKVRSLNPAVAGSICMSYRQTLGGCTNSCLSGPFVTTLVPNASCQLHLSSVVAPCIDRWYQVNVAAPGPHEFTTCALTCAGGFVSGLDSKLELYTSGCALLASDDDGCGAPRSSLTFNMPAPGIYKLRVRSMTGSAGTFGLTYRTVGPLCTAPSAVTLGPSAGTASSAINTCTMAETFNVTSAGTSSPMTYNWVITPPALGSAMPANGSVNGAAGPTNPASFGSLLTGEGMYTVNLTASNACGSVPASVNYVLSDLTSPLFTAFPADVTVECTAVPPVPPLAASDNCDPSPMVSFSEVTTPGGCAGEYTITRTWSALDRAGNISAPQSQVINVVDTLPPVITPDTSTKFCLWPPNHQLVCFLQEQFSPAIADDCSEPLTWRFSGVVSSEEGFKCGDGNMDPDVVLAPDGSGFCVRSERCGQDPANNDGRIYLLLGTATDACGNTSDATPVGTVFVPHDHSEGLDCIRPK